MPKKARALTDRDGEVREIGPQDLAAFRPAAEVLPPALARRLGVRGPQRAPTKERITIRLSPDVVAWFKATGDGWQTRIDAALRDWVREHPTSASRT